MPITDPLDLILREWSQLDPPFLPDLEPGLTTQQINFLTQNLPFVLPTAVVELYQWHNGTPDSELFTPLSYLMPLEDAIETYVNYIRPDLEAIKESLSEKPDSGDEALADFYFPVFSDAGGGLLLVPCGADPQGNGPVIDWEGDARVMYLNLQTLVKTVADCYEKGAYWLKNEGFDMVEIVEKQWTEIHRLHNPNISYWWE